MVWSLNTGHTGASCITITIDRITSSKYVDYALLTAGGICYGHPGTMHTLDKQTDRQTIAHLPARPPLLLNTALHHTAFHTWPAGWPAYVIIPKLLNMVRWNTEIMLLVGTGKICQRTRSNNVKGSYILLASQLVERNTTSTYLCTLHVRTYMSSSYVD